MPFGVVGIIYEGRPNVTADAAGICLKSGNAALLRGSSSAPSSNAAIVSVLRDAIGRTRACRPTRSSCSTRRTRDSVKELMRARGLVDVLIPRGGADLIKSVVEESTVPVIETGVGNCHVYVDAAADLEMALADRCSTRRRQRPSICNTAESLLVHADSRRRVPAAGAARRCATAGVTVHGDPRRGRAYSADVVPATDEDYAHRIPVAGPRRPPWSTRWTPRVDHIRRYGSGHTEAIVTESQPPRGGSSAGSTPPP